MNRLLFGMILLAVGCLAGSCTDDDEYTQGVWMRRSDLDGVARGQASSFTIGNKGYLCCGYRGSNKTYLKDLWEYNMDGDYWTQCADMPDAAAVFRRPNPYIWQIPGSMIPLRILGRRGMTLAVVYVSVHWLSQSEGTAMWVQGSMIII